MIKAKYYWLNMDKTINGILNIKHILPTSKSLQTQNHLVQSAEVVKYIDCISAEYKVPLYCHRFQVHSGPEWKHMIGSYLWAK